MTADALGERTEQCEPMHPQGCQIIRGRGVAADESARQACGAERQALGDFWTLALAASNLEAAAANVQHQECSGGERCPGSRGEIGQARLFDTRQHLDRDTSGVPHPAQYLHAIRRLANG